MRKVERIGITEILGKEIVFYGDWENPLFLGRDVADWIEHSDVSTLLRRLEVDSEKVANIVCTLSGEIKGWYLYSEYQHLVPEYADYRITKYNQTLKWTEECREFILEFVDKK